MDQDTLTFRITRLDASVPEGLPVEWQGTELASGPLRIELDHDSEKDGNQGWLDYSKRRAYAEFHVTLKFPDFAGILEGLGIDPALTQPVRAVLRSEGEILQDHGFALSGRCQLEPHALFPPDTTCASVLPGY
jgi:hypothetical protein